MCLACSLTVTQLGEVWWQDSCLLSGEYKDQPGLGKSLGTWSLQTTERLTDPPGGASEEEERGVQHPGSSPTPHRREPCLSLSPRQRAARRPSEKQRSQVPGPAKSPPADQPRARQHLSRPVRERMANATRSVVDPDMVALFDQFLGPEGAMKPFFSESEEVTASPILYSLRDHDQKGLYLHEECLVAAPLQGPNTAHEEVLSVLPNKYLERTKFPLILGVKGGKQGLSCGKSEEPKLQLEDVDLAELFKDSTEAKRFTFFKDYNGSTHTFESAAFPQWFLCSAVEAHKPLAVTNHPGEAAITTFYFQRK